MIISLILSLSSMALASNSNFSVCEEIKAQWEQSHPEDLIPKDFKLKDLSLIPTTGNSAWSYCVWGKSDSGYALDKLIFFADKDRKPTQALSAEGGYKSDQPEKIWFTSEKGLRVQGAYCPHLSRIVKTEKCPDKKILAFLAKKNKSLKNKKWLLTSATEPDAKGFPQKFSVCEIDPKSNGLEPKENGYIYLSGGDFKKSPLFAATKFCWNHEILSAKKISKDWLSLDFPFYYDNGESMEIVTNLLSLRQGKKFDWHYDCPPVVNKKNQLTCKASALSSSEELMDYWTTIAQSFFDNPCPECSGLPATPDFRRRLPKSPPCDKLTEDLTKSNSAAEYKASKLKLYQQWSKVAKKMIAEKNVEKIKPEDIPSQLKLEEINKKLESISWNAKEVEYLFEVKNSELINSKCSKIR